MNVGALVGGILLMLVGVWIGGVVLGDTPFMRRACKWYNGLGRDRKEHGNDEQKS